jgi:glycosyltransferase involved in cell wall biosynthesis
MAVDEPPMRPPAQAVQAGRSLQAAAPPGDAPATLLLYLSVPLHLRDGVPMLEDQACNGLRLWAEHFDRLIVVILKADRPAPPSWVPLATAVGPAMDRIEIVTVPEAYRPDRFLRALPGAIPVLRDAISRADYLGFAIGGLFGDWGAVGAFLAHRMGLPFYVWTDRVESDVVRQSATSGPWRRRLMARLTHRPMAWVERYLIRRADLGLFHGQETFDTFAPYSRNPHVVHDIHIRKSDHIDPARLTAKQAAAAGGGRLRFAYTGRADAMKGPHDWLSVMESLAASCIDFEATWLGDGDLADQMRARVASGVLRDRVRLPGFVRDRTAVLETLRAADLMVFCHKTPESPRCLIEALISGTPIAGYDSAFPRGLIQGNTGGVLTPRDDVPALAAAIADLARDRARLADLIGRAAADGASFDDETVFRHRSELIKAHLPRTRPPCARPAPGAAAGVTPAAPAAPR